MSQTPDTAELEVTRDVEALGSDAELANMFVAEALDHLSTIEATLLKLEETPDDRELLNDVFRPFHTVKGNAGALGVMTVQALAHKVESLLDRCRSGQHVLGPAEVDLILRSVDLLSAMINDLATRVAGQPGRILRDERLALIVEVEGFLDGSTVSTPVVEASHPGADTARADERRVVSDRRVDERRSEAQTSIKVDTRKLDGLIDCVGELVILQSLVYEDPALLRVADERLTRNLAQLRRITTDLQRSAMAMRMVPIRQTFQKMARLVRDLSKNTGKQVELVMSGEDTELDRKVVEDINDPLMHMVRNSVDHGIESAEKRAAAGKSETGRLTLRAFHQGGNIVIEVGDDGAGLNTAAILKKAQSQGILEPGAAIDPAVIHHLIFAPGFSTADQVTEISGRGVGMDVVRRNIEALRGRIDIETAQGRGTTFAIRLPLTLAILEGLLVRAGGERFVIPTFSVRESLRPAASQIHTVRGVPRLIQVRNELLPLVQMSDVLGVAAPDVAPTEGTVVVLEDGNRRVALVVEALIGKQEVVVKSLGDAMAGIEGVAGGAILGDGRIGLILDAHGIVRTAGSQGGARPQAA